MREKKNKKHQRHYLPICLLLPPSLSLSLYLFISVCTQLLQKSQTSHSKQHGTNIREDEGEQEVMEGVRGGKKWCDNRTDEKSR